MRLLMRANAHRPVVSAGGVPGTEIASSPDTAGRPERWQWHLRLLDGAGHATDEATPGASVPPVEDGEPARSAVTVELGSAAGGALLEVAVDPEVVRPRVEVLDIVAHQVLERDEREVLALLVASGSCLVEGRHLLHERDALVLEGDDPISVSVTPAAEGPTSLATVLLSSAAGGSLGWVP